MVGDTLNRIERRIRDDRSVPESSRTELLAMLDALRPEIEDLERTHAGQAERIAAHIEESTHGALDRAKGGSILRAAVDGLSEAIVEFEETHAPLVEKVNSISTMLANLGF